MACTATATQEVASEISQRLGLRDPLLVRAGFDRPNLSFDIVRFEGKGSKARKLAMLLHGLRNEQNRQAIVYCGTRKDTEGVAQSLREAGLSAAGYHAGMNPDERASAQHRFMTGDAEVITATNAFGMGVDKADVRSVWHWAIPTSVEAYYQEAGRAGRDGLPARAVLLAGRSDLGRLVRFIKMRTVEPESVSLYAQRLKAGSDSEGNLSIDAPRLDEDRVKLAIAERAGAFEVEPAPGGRLELRLNDRIDLAAARAACKSATDRSWRAYRAVESFAFGENCRRRRLLDHFGDSTPGSPEGRCCDICDPDSCLPSPDELEVKAKRRPSKNPPPAADLSPEDKALLEALRAWRLKAARGKPAYTVANNRTLEGIAASRPRDADGLAEIHGVGPRFLRRHGDDVLALIASR
jgi:superfamily II DNA helicase RecQ